MPDEVQIAQFQVSDQPALLSFLRTAYPGDLRKSEPAYWRWHYLENPFTSTDNVPLWVVKSGTKVVGQLATIPVDLKVGNEITRAIWILDFIVDGNYRGRGLGKRLVLAAGEWCPTMITLGINEQSTAVFRSLKWKGLEGLHRYHKLIFPGYALGEFARIAPVRAIANLGFAVSRARIRRRVRGDNDAIKNVDTFGSAFDDLWGRASVQWPCSVTRGAAFLDWQFRRQPGKQFNVLGYYERDLLVGYVVLFFRKPERAGVSPKAAITDLCYQPEYADKIIKGLLAAALKKALEQRAGSLVTDILDERVENWLKRYGFWQIKNAPQFMASTNERQRLIYSPRNWYLTRADSDVSIFEQQNV
ncbi:MAG: GNAT family N-acetyltransferase [Pyrinomonadaceae bacterium]